MDRKKNITTTTTTTTRTFTKRQTQTLTREEELVIRMTRGLSEGPDHELEFRGVGNHELNAHLALIEAAVMAEVYGTGPLAAPATTVNTEAKERIIEKLSKLGE